MSVEAIDYMQKSFHSSLQWLQSKFQLLSADDESEYSPADLQYNDKRFNGSVTRLTVNRTLRPDGKTYHRNSTKRSPIQTHKQMEDLHHSFSPNMDDIERKKFDKLTGSLKASSTMKKARTDTLCTRRTGHSKSTISLPQKWSTDANTIKPQANYSSDGNNVYRNFRRLDNECRRAIYELKYSRNDVGAGSMGITDTDSLNGISSFTPPITQTYNRLNEYNFTFEPFSLQLPNIYGELKIMFQFFKEENYLHVTLLKATNVARTQGGALGVYAKVCLMPAKIQAKVGHDKHNSHNPVFCEPFMYRITLEELFDSQLRVKLYNKPRMFSRSEAIGECSIALRRYDPTAVNVIWQNLMRNKLLVRKQRTPKGRFRRLMCEWGTSVSYCP